MLIVYKIFHFVSFLTIYLPLGFCCLSFKHILTITNDETLCCYQTNEKQILKLVEGLSIEQLNKVPARFNNNIICNLGHLICSLQTLCYKLSGLDPRISLNDVLNMGGELNLKHL